jgi:hypothetical protein
MLLIADWLEKLGSCAKPPVYPIFANRSFLFELQLI